MKKRHKIPLKYICKLFLKKIDNFIALAIFHKICDLNYLPRIITYTLPKNTNKILYLKITLVKFNYLLSSYFYPNIYNYAFLFKSQMKAV